MAKERSFGHEIYEISQLWLLEMTIDRCGGATEMKNFQTFLRNLATMEFKGK